MDFSQTCRRGAARAVLRAERLMRRGANALLSAVGGLSDERLLARATRLHWDASLEALDPEHARSGLADWERDLYGTHLPAGGPVAVIGCGGGRELLALARMGRTVEGVDLSPRAVERARAEAAAAGIDAPVHLADIRTLELSPRRYGAVIVAGSVYSFLPGAERRLEVLARCTRGLLPDGVLIVTYEKRRPDQDRLAGRLMRWAARLSANPRQPELGDTIGPGGVFVHFFTEQEIRAEAARAGLEVAQISGSFSGAAVLRPALDPQSAQKAQKKAVSA